MESNKCGSLFLFGKKIFKWSNKNCKEERTRKKLRRNERGSIEEQKKK